MVSQAAVIDNPGRVWTWADDEAGRLAGIAVAVSPKGRAAKLSDAMGRVLLNLDPRNERPVYAEAPNTIQALLDRGLIEPTPDYWGFVITEAAVDIIGDVRIDAYRPSPEEIAEREAEWAAAARLRDEQRDHRCYVAAAPCGCTVAFASIDIGIQPQWARDGVTVELVDSDTMRERMSAGANCTHPQDPLPVAA